MPSPSGIYPRGSIHQKNVISAIDAILKMNDGPFDAFKKGNGFNKVVRNYQYWVEELTPRTHRCPYNSGELAPIYFRMTGKACSQLKNNSATPKVEALHKIHQEHAVPVSWVVTELINLRELNLPKWTLLDIENIVRTSEIILVTSEQRDELDGVKSKKLTSGKFCHGLQRTMPASWKFTDCHLARICKLQDAIVGVRML